VGLVPFLWALRAAGPRRGLLLGAAFGVAFFGTTLYWIGLFGVMAWTALVLMSAGFATLFGLAAPVFARPGRPFLRAAGVASLWVVVEWLRSMFPLGGFTWGTLGVSQVENRITLRLASVAGVWGVTFVVVAVNALIVEALAGGGGARRRLSRVAVAAALALGPIAIAFPSASGPPVDVATVQVDVRLARNTDGLFEDRAVAMLNVREDRTLATDPPDLVVWGEGALDPGATSDPRTLTAVRDAIASVGALTLTGAVTNDALGAQRTEALLFDGRGALVDRYAKVHLVPFGEYVPWRNELGWIKALEQIPVDRVPGDRVHTMQIPGLPTFGTPICFENSFAGIDRAMVRQGATFLVITTNDASYGTTAASAQQLEMSRMRAVEDGRWIVHAAVSGISAFIDPSGRAVSTTGLFEPAILRGTIRSSESRTWYVRLGDWLPRLSLLFLAGLFVVPRRRRTAPITPPPLPARPRTLVILPTYEERDTIEWVLEHLSALPDGVEMLVVDDSSPDGTADIVRSEASRNPRIRLEQRSEKSGLASAYMGGFRIGIDEGFDLIVEMDSDLSHDPAELSRLLAGARDHDLTVGSRYVPGGSVTNWGRARVVLSKAGNTYARLMLGVPIRDATSGYRVYRRQMLERLISDPVTADGYGFQIELVRRAWRLGYDIGEVPITFREREHGHSKISRRIVLEALWKVTIWGLEDRLGVPRPSGAERP
jgi:apolipoprotein N-acyltransferase